MSRPSSPLGLHKQLDAIWRTPPGLARLSSVNHTILGKRFMALALTFFAIGGLLSMLIRAQLATPNSAFIGPELYNQIFTMHGTEKPPAAGGFFISAGAWRARPSWPWRFGRPDS